MKSLRFAIIGLGGMGKVHAKNLYAGRVKNVRLAAICDHDPAVLAWAKTEYPDLPLYLNDEEMIEKEPLDAIVVATPHYSHIQIAIRGLKKGLHVLVEKPLAVTAPEAEELLALKKEHPELVSGVAFNQRSNRVYQKAKELLPKLGTLRSARYEISDWYRPDSYYRMNPWRGSFEQEGGGGLINQCHHQLDIIVYLLGLPEAVEAHCKTINREVSGENDVVAFFYYPTFTLLFSASLHDLKGMNFFDISGDNGRLNMEKTKLVFEEHENEFQANKEAQLYGGVVSKESHFSYGAKRLKEDQLYAQQVRALRAFSEEIMGQGHQLASLEDGFRDLELLNAIYLSSWTDKKVALPVDENLYAEALKKKIIEEKAK